jgi:NADH-quinone oxidoreductase subunit E
MSNPLNNEYDLNKMIDATVKKYGAKASALILILQDIQSHYRYLPKEALVAVSKKMKLPLPQVYGVATFYKSFSLEPKGKHHICVCSGSSCHTRKAQAVAKQLEQELGITTGKTTADGQFSLEKINCLGLCSLGPNVSVNDTYYTNMTAAKVTDLLRQLRTKQKSAEPAGEVA